MAASSGGQLPPALDKSLFDRVKSFLSPGNRPLISQLQSNRNITLDNQKSLPSLQKELETAKATLDSSDSDIIPAIDKILQIIPNLASKILTYSESHRGPFIVVIENDKIGNLHPMNIGKIIHQQAKAPKVISISRRGPNRVAVELDSHSNANSFLTNEFMMQAGYHLYVPQRLLTCKGIIRNVGDSINDKDLMEVAVARLGSQQVKVLDIRRLNRKVTDKEGVTINVLSNSYVLTFEGRTLPKFLYLYNSISEIHPFINPVSFCDNCARFGHHKTVCKSKTRCLNCKEAHSTQNFDNYDNSCGSCGKEGHLANNRCCEEFARQRKINEIMAIEGLSFMEAAKKVPRINGYGIQSSYIPQPQHFPSLPSPSTLPNFQQSSVSISPQARQRRTPTYSRNESPTNSQPPKKKRVESPGYDVAGHNNLLIGSQLPSSSPNGSFLSQFSASQQAQLASPPPNPFHHELSYIQNMFLSGQKVSDIDLIKIKSFFFNFFPAIVLSPNEDPSMEYA